MRTQNKETTAHGVPETPTRTFTQDTGPIPDYKTHAEALAEACRYGLKFLQCAMDNRENQTSFRNTLTKALAAYEAAQ